MTKLLTSEPHLRKYIDASAELATLPFWMYRGSQFTPGELLEGIILNESAGDAVARRYEPHQDRIEDGDVTGRDDGPYEDDASYGLMQVMGYNVRVLCGVPVGVRMNFTFLYLPQTNISFGLRILTGEIRTSMKLMADQPEYLPYGGAVERALCRYNGGSTGDRLVDIPGNKKDYRLRAYIDRISDHALVAKADRNNRGWAQ